MTKERAQELRQAVWRSIGRRDMKLMTAEEDAEIRAFQETLGDSSYYRALARMAEGEHLGVRRAITFIADGTT